MKTLFTILLLLMLMGCASTEGSKGTDPHVSYGGTVRTRGVTSHGM